MQDGAEAYYGALPCVVRDPPICAGNWHQAVRLAMGAQSRVICARSQTLRGLGLHPLADAGDD
jgi:hypothetical protein